MKPKVSFCCISYNHENFIRDTLDGFASQILPYEYEVIICDDNSTDHTASIISTYRDKFKHFNYKRNEVNIGAINNFVQALSMCKGQYIALCEGDDFWTNPYKIQKQIEFLEGNPDYVSTHHSIKILRDNGETEIWNAVEEDIDIFKLAESNKIATVSCVFRNPFDRLPTWISKLPIGDYPLHLFNAQFGLTKCIPEVMATYRIHQGGIFESKANITKLNMLLTTLDGMIDHFPKPIRIKLIEQQIDLLENCKKDAGFQGIVFLPNLFMYLSSEKKRLDHRVLHLGSFQGFLHNKWSNFQSKLKAQTNGSKR